MVAGELALADRPESREGLERGVGGRWAHRGRHGSEGDHPSAASHGFVNEPAVSVRKPVELAGGGGEEWLQQQDGLFVCMHGWLMAVVMLFACTCFKPYRSDTQVLYT
uniref:Uncharacterized protein n=1 Tax=Oryza barthii TaxID=65489 RepID=A0A0D3G3P2_9ORYZ